MATEMNLQMSANRNEESDRVAPPRRPRAKPVSRAAKRVIDVGTNHPSRKPANGAVGRSKPCDTAEDSDAAGEFLPMSAIPYATDKGKASTAIVVRELAPRQVRAAVMLVEGRRGKDVAAAIGVSPESISRWRHRPEFEALTRQLLQESIDATRLGIASLCVESVDHLRGLIRSFDDRTALAAISLVLNRAAPVLGIAGTEVRSGHGRS